MTKLQSNNFIIRPTESTSLGHKILQDLKVELARCHRQTKLRSPVSSYFGKFIRTLNRAPKRGHATCEPRKESKHTTSMYEVRRAGIKGLGLFAKSAIPKGTRILTERPTLFITKDQDSGDVYTAFRLLSSKEQAKVLHLSAHVTSPILRWTHVLWFSTQYSSYQLVLC